MRDACRNRQNKKILKIFDPMKLSTAISTFFNAPIEVSNPGSEVPPAIGVNPIAISHTENRRVSEEGPSTR